MYYINTLNNKIQLWHDNYRNVQVVIHVSDILRYLQQLWDMKISVISTDDKVTSTAEITVICSLSILLQCEISAAGVSENKDVIFFLPEIPSDPWLRSPE